MDLCYPEKQYFRAVLKRILKHGLNSSSMAPLSQLAYYIQKIKTKPCMI